MLKDLKKRYTLFCPNTHYHKKYHWRIIVLHILAKLFGVYFEINDVKFGTSKNNPLKTYN